MSDDTDYTPEPIVLMPEKNVPVGPVDRSAWVRPWAQLKFVSFQPAIFPRMLGEVSRDANPGDLVNVYDKFGNRVGIGLYNPRAKMPLRVVIHTAEPMGEEYFENALRRAVALRRDMFKLDAQTEAYRVVNSDGDGVSGLTIDRYADTLYCDVYSLGIFQRLPKWLPLLHGLLGTKHVRVHVDHDLGSLEGIKPSQMKEITASAPAKVRILEHGVKYEVDFAEGHKTGFFCDQRDNRKRFGTLVAGARVLDLCSYTGGFSINAILGAMFVLIIVFSFYFAVLETGVDDFLHIIVPKQHQTYVLDLWKRSQRKIGLWMQGQLLLAVIMGVLVYLGLTIIGVQHALVLAVIAAWCKSAGKTWLGVSEYRRPSHIFMSPGESSLVGTDSRPKAVPNRRTNSGQPPRRLLSRASG